ncbi:HD domain-containing protein [Serratia marcescens]|uniref:HD domain-containing protein n=1 Tax=Serratia marcescens TaxID=615 RepID=UPI0032047407
MESIVTKAMLFAKENHELINHLRKYTNEPYINHLASVVRIVQSVEHTDEMLAAAWLHDTVEDTSVELFNIKEIFGCTISSYVEMLTDISKESDGNRIIRKNIDLIHLSKSYPDVKTIKIADIIDNAIDIFNNDKKFSRVYAVESARLLTVLTEGNSLLYEKAISIINEIIMKLSRTHDNNWYEKIDDKYNADLYVDTTNIVRVTNK